mmetsp:Transcript_4230/g.4341  ORF Transcript_4230/g.4341 Transcript_4230/m.4341 type:complete len:323 (-) Transcript_4230:201-1169(-)
MQDSTPLLNSYQKGVLEDVVSSNDIENEKGTEISLSPSPHRRLVTAVIVFLTVICTSLLYHNDFLDKWTGANKQFAAMARRDPGESMNNGDELWPCKSDPQISGASCDPNSVVYSNIYVDPGYATTNLPPYKMLFYESDIKLYARNRATSDCAWGLEYTQIMTGMIKCNGVTVSIDDWGASYWEMSNDYTPSNNDGEFDAAWLNEREAHKLDFIMDQANSDYGITWSRRNTNRNTWVVKYKITTVALTWGCDGIAFVLTTDGNLVLGGTQSDALKASVGKRYCNVLFQTHNYMANGGVTTSPTEEPVTAPLSEIDINLEAIK